MLGERDNDEKPVVLEEGELEKVLEDESPEREEGK